MKKGTNMKKQTNLLICILIILCISVFSGCNKQLKKDKEGTKTTTEKTSGSETGNLETGDFEDGKNEDESSKSKEGEPYNGEYTLYDGNSLMDYTGKREGVDGALKYTSDQVKNYYDLVIDFDADNHALDIEQNLVYVNNTGDDLKDMYFNIIPDAFEEECGGPVKVDKLTIDDKDYEFTKEDTTVYSVNLEDEIESGSTAQVYIKYRVVIPGIEDRFGYVDGEYNIGNAIITPAMYEGGKWLSQPYVEIGDAFYTDIADYKAVINVPDGYKVATSGTLDDGVFYAKSVRDFAMFISNTCEVMEDTFDDIAINVYYLEGDGALAPLCIDAAKDSFELFNEAYGGYPYDSMNIAITPQSSGVGGMEYPGLIMISSGGGLDGEGYDTDDDYEKDSFKQIVAHEMAHQWFYGIVGNDEVRFPFVDEAYATFSEWLYSEKCLDGSLSGYREGFGPIVDNTDNPGELLDRSLYDWGDAPETEAGYGLIYFIGGCMHIDMMDALGKDEFMKDLKGYVEKYAFAEVSRDDFVDYWSQFDETKKVLENYGLK